MEELKANDIFYKEEPTGVSAGYIPVKLSSVGKLGVPAILHVRDYTFEEAMKLSEITEETELQTICEVLKSVIFEDINPGDLHKQDILEILMNIQNNWYFKTIENFPYVIDESLPKDKLYKKENVSRATIPLSSIKTKPLKEGMKLPITIKNETINVQLLLHKVKNEILAKEITEEKFAEEENRIQPIKKKIQQDDYTSTELEKYNGFLRRKSLMFMRVLQSQLIYSYNGKVLETLEEKMDALKKIGLNVWNTYNQILENSFDFGIDPEVEFQCSVTHKKITRRFNFRSLHFLLSLEPKDSSGFDISFG